MNRSQNLINVIEANESPLGWYVIDSQENAIIDGPFESERQAKANLDDINTQEVDYGKGTDKGYFVKVKSEARTNRDIGDSLESISNQLSNIGHTDLINILKELGNDSKYRQDLSDVRNSLSSIQVKMSQLADKIKHNE